MRRALAFLCALALLAPGAARAADNHPFLGIIAGGTEIEPLRDACGVAADAEGNRYLADYYHVQLAIFNYQPIPDFALSGGRLTASGSRGLISEPPASTDAPCAMAVDSAGRLYADLWHEGVVRYLPAVYPFPVQSVPPFGAPVAIDPGPATGVAVDRSDGRLYVAHRTYVAAYEADGSPVMEGGEPLRIGGGASHNYYGLAVSGYAGTAGRLYVGDAAAGEVLAFDLATSTETPVQAIDGAAAPQGGFADLADTSLALDDSDGHLLAVDDLGGGAEHPTAVVDEFGPGGEYLGQLPRSLVFARPSGLAVDNSAEATHGLVYATSGAEEESTLLAFCPTSSSGALASLCPAAGPTHLLRVAKTGAGQGSVFSTPGSLACGVLCAWEFAAGSTLTLAAAPAPHSVFAGWSVAGAPGACPGTIGCTLSLNADTEVSAEFVALPEPPEEIPAEPPVEPAGEAPRFSAAPPAAESPAGAAAPRNPAPRAHHHHHHHHRHRPRGRAQRKRGMAESGRGA